MRQRNLYCAAERCWEGPQPGEELNTGILRCSDSIVCEAGHSLACEGGCLGLPSARREGHEERPNLTTMRVGQLLLGKCV